MKRLQLAAAPFGESQKKEELSTIHETHQLPEQESRTDRKSMKRLKLTAAPFGESQKIVSY